MELLQSTTDMNLVQAPPQWQPTRVRQLDQRSDLGNPAHHSGDVPYITSGQLRASTILRSHRFATLQTLQALPTLDMTGGMGFEYEPGRGMFAPAVISPEILDRVHDALHKVLADRETKNEPAHRHLELRILLRQRIVNIVRGDIAKWSRVIKTLGIIGK